VTAAVAAVKAVAVTAAAAVALGLQLCRGTQTQAQTQQQQSTTLDKPMTALIQTAAATSCRCQQPLAAAGWRCVCDCLRYHVQGFLSALLVLLCPVQPKKEGLLEAAALQELHYSVLQVNKQCANNIWQVQLATLYREECASTLRICPWVFTTADHRST
jgi:hypothetical protein